MTFHDRQRARIVYRHVLRGHARILAAAFIHVLRDEEKRSLKEVEDITGIPIPKISRIYYQYPLETYGPYMEEYREWSRS